MRLTFGYAGFEGIDAAKAKLTELMALVGERAGVDITVESLDSYDRVTQRIHKGELDLAWVSPIPFIALSRSESVVPLASPQRGGTHYHGAIVVAASSPIGALPTLAGKRAAWVDRYSAAGFVVPRIELAKAGLDPRSAFASQRFYGSHAAAVTAVANGEADFAATFVRLAPNGAIVGGPWTHDAELERKLRIFATLGEIPPDVLVARSALDAGVRDRVRDALLAIARSARSQEILDKALGAEGLFVPNPAIYEPLREEALAAVREQLLDV